MSCGLGALPYTFHLFAKQSSPLHRTKMTSLSLCIMMKTSLIILLILLPACTGQMTPVLTPPPTLPLAVNCTNVRIPPSLCTTCRMRPFNEQGKFASRRNIYRLGGRRCQAGLRRYAELNPCDTIRNYQIANQGEKGVMRDLAQFMYSICETCCDCIPLGARPGEWAVREARGIGALFRARRGNCVVHTLFDMCKMWPFVKSVVAPNKPFRDNWPEICPLLMEWFRSPARDGWQTNPSVELRPVVSRFIWQFIGVMNCRKEVVWEECAALETALGKI